MLGWTRVLAFLSGLLCGPDQSIQGHSYLMVPLAGGVLVDQRRAGAGVTDPRHDLFQRRSGLLEVMQVQFWVHPCHLDRCLPDAVEVVSPWRGTFRDPGTTARPALGR